MICNLSVQGLVLVVSITFCCLGLTFRFSTFWWLFFTRKILCAFLNRSWSGPTQLDERMSFYWWVWQHGYNSSVPSVEVWPKGVCFNWFDLKRTTSYQLTLSPWISLSKIIKLMQPTCLVVSDSCCSIRSTTFLKGGLLKGSASQQDLIIWYLHTKTPSFYMTCFLFMCMMLDERKLPFRFHCFYAAINTTLSTQSILHFKGNSHFTGCKLWRIHFVSFFYQFVELGVHRHARIGTISYIQQ